MWKCKKCSETIEDSFDSCWKCGTENDGSEPRSNFIPEEVKVAPMTAPAPGKRSRSELVMARYRDAYLLARTTATIGSVVKVVAIVLACLIAITGINLFGAAFAFQVILLSLSIGIGIYLIGVLISAHAQVMTASLDSAVQGSPFLTKDEMAQVMSL